MIHISKVQLIDESAMGLFYNLFFYSIEFAIVQVAQIYCLDRLGCFFSLERLIFDNNAWVSVVFPPAALPNLMAVLASICASLNRPSLYKRFARVS